MPPLDDTTLVRTRRSVAGSSRIPIINPATEREIGSIACAALADLDLALDSSAEAFKTWKLVPAITRSTILSQTAQILRERSEAIAITLTREQGKPLKQARIEVTACVETFEWYAAEARRAYGRLIPARTHGARQMVIPEPIGPVAAFSAWNFPGLLASRKIAPALAAGCTCIIKPPEETPATVLAIGRALADAGLPAGVLNIVFGVPAEISAHLIKSPIIRKITFTGSVPVGKLLARLAADHVKPCTLELGGHAAVIVMEDADMAFAAQLSALGKTRNAGQVCTSPTRFYVQRSAYEEFTDRFAAELNKLPIGDGFAASTELGPLANNRRLAAMQELTADARRRGGEIVTGGNRFGNCGYFFEPTVVTGLRDDAAMMVEEPFGPIASVAPFDELDEALDKANGRSVGLAGYAFTRDHASAVAISEGLEVGVLGINSFAVSQAEAPFGGVKESGYGYEGGPEGLAGYLHQKYVHHAAM
jgi:succinate-semialdehyde dehydrogenase/glutarate-semialdehyde dehydrogenase